jgi:hypothetical protein
MQATLSKNHSTRTLKINAFCFASDKKILYVFENFSRIVKVWKLFLVVGK